MLAQYRTGGSAIRSLSTVQDVALYGSSVPHIPYQRWLHGSTPPLLSTGHPATIAHVSTGHSVGKA
eukprot:102720-Rhodomonas_salina.1